MSLTKMLYITSSFTIMILQSDFPSVIYSIYSPNTSVICHLSSPSEHINNSDNKALLFSKHIMLYGHILT